MLRRKTSFNLNLWIPSFDVPLTLNACLVLRACDGCKSRLFCNLLFSVCEVFQPPKLWSNVASVHAPIIYCFSMMSLRFFLFSKQLTRDLFLCERCWSLSKSKLFLRHQSAFLKRRTLFMNKTCIISSVSIPWQHRTHSTRRPCGRNSGVDMQNIPRCGLRLPQHSERDRNHKNESFNFTFLFFLWVIESTRPKRTKNSLEGNSPQNNRKRFFTTEWDIKICSAS